MLRLYYPIGGDANSSPPVGTFTPPHMFRSFANGTHTTPSVMFNVPPGFVAVSYLWTDEAGPGPILADTPTANPTTFTCTGTDAEIDTLYQCVATDALGNTATGSGLFVLFNFGTIP